MIISKVTESYCSNIEKFFRLKAVTAIVVHIREDIWGTDSLALASDVSSPSLGPPARPSEGNFARLEPARSSKT